MQKQKNRLLLILGGAVILAVAGAFVYRQVQQARAVQMAQAAVARLEADRAEAARRAAQIAALEKRLAELNQTYNGAMKKAFLLRQQLLTHNKDTLALDVEAARRAVEEALDHHPAIVAMQQQLTQSVETAVKLSNQQAEVLTKIHAIWSEHANAKNSAVGDIFKQMAAARKTYLASIHAKDLVHAKIEEVQAWNVIQEGYDQKLNERLAAETNWPPDEVETQLTQNYQALGTNRIAADDHYESVYADIPTTRARLLKDDPAIAAMAKDLNAKLARMLAAVDATPELSALLQQMEAIDQQRTAVLAELTILRSLSMAGSAKMLQTPG